jgi:hypothetical protein
MAKVLTATAIIVESYSGSVIVHKQAAVVFLEVSALAHLGYHEIAE